MKKQSILFLLITMLLILTSCNMGIKQIDESEGNVNYYIYPYLKFTLSEDKTYYTASVVKGAKLTTVRIPGEAHYQTGGIPVKEFAGFESAEDASSLKVLTLDVNVSTISEGALDNASSLERVETTGSKEGPVWAELPILKKTGYHFLGWKAGDTYVKKGDPIDPKYPTAVPVFEAHIMTEHKGYEATCTAPGLMTSYECSVCHGLYADIEGKTPVTQEELVIPAKGHTLTYHEEVKADCTTGGNIAYFECSACGLYFTDSEGKHQVTDVNTDPLGHVMGELIPYSQPTCEKEGVKEHYTCERCGKHYLDIDGLYEIADPVLQKVPHTYYEEWKYNSNNHYHECIWCHQAFDTAEHTFGDPEVKVHPTLTQKGTYKYTCTVCSYWKTEDIPEGDHVPEFVERVEATCTKRGYDIYRCKACGEVVYHNYVNALGHDVILIERTEPTCTEEGVERHYHCERCGYNFSNPEATVPMDKIKIDPLGHSWKTIWSKDDDNHWHECSRCGKKKDIADHAYDQQVIIIDYKLQDANCTEPAKYFYSCICGAKGTETFDYGDPKGHTLTHHEAKASTCTVQGNIEYWSCSVCNKNFSDEDGMNEITGSVLLPLSNHSWDEGYQADSTQHWHVCTVCGTASDKENHNRIYGADETHHWHQCSVCGYRMSENEAHNFTIQGDTKYCKVCGKTVERTDSEPGFDVDPVYPAPTGEIDKSFDSETGKWTFTLRATNSGSVPTDWTWYVDDGLQAGETADTFVFVPPRPESYVVMCIFWNTSGYGSASVTIN